MAAEPSRIASADMSACVAGTYRVEDEGRTIVIDGTDPSGAPALAGMRALAGWRCTARALGTPESVTSRVDASKPIDGVQTASADGLTYTWSMVGDVLHVTITEP